MLLGLVVFTFVLLLGRLLNLVELVINKGIPLLDIARLFLSILPTFLVLTIPLAFLLGVMLGFGRLSADREILALKSSGISLYQMARPILLLSLPACLLTAAMTLYLRPASETFFRQQLFDIAASHASVGLQSQVFNDEFDGLVLYANQIDDRSGTMRQVFISDERDSSAPTIIMADKGRLVSDSLNQKLLLRLEEGTMHRQPQNKANGTETSTYQVLGFSKYDVNLDLEKQSSAAKKRRRKNKELSLTELRSSIETASTEKRQDLLAELHTRMVLPAAPLLFALLGVPLGIQPHRSGRGGNFALALGVFLCYYLLLSFADTLVADAGWPAATLWIPNLCFLLSGLYLLYRAAIERPVTIFERTFGALFGIFRGFFRRGGQP
ncbi:LPS export ABC transporter permease LptF [Syntrophotalea acetylenivorans]|uniref:LPS export ABC transporter permease LptF n=2 Tax=Syntrophotalea acetylenivorans TaxID=1842532 RepID=A0A1L3GMS7_9BACT|nr:LPS export ABC transporter permease LptF [Syntrophotalea acetylenivorans]